MQFKEKSQMQMELEERVSGYVEAITADYGFLHVDNLSYDIEIYFHRNNCAFDFRKVRVKDRFRFGIRPNKSRPGCWVAYNMHRELKSDQLKRIEKAG
jgi:hypothetical protein